MIRHTSDGHRVTLATAGPGDSFAGATIALAEVGNRLVVRSKAAHQPHHLDVAQNLTLKTAARLNPG